MRVLTKDEFLHEKRRFFDLIKKGAVFIYPTDTIYGLSCDATNKEATKKVRKLKNRPDFPFSLHVPSKEWIRENCEVDEKAEEWIKKLPGPYTIILKIKKVCTACTYTNHNMETLGVRIPNYWTSQMVKELDVPIITTSVNKAGEDYMTSLEDMDDDIKQHVDFIIHEGHKKGKPSTIVNLADGESIREREKIK